MDTETSRTDGMPAAFQPGFRFSVGDVVILIVAAAFAKWAYDRNGLWLAKVTGFVVANFFLFCNVFRIARSLELIWTGLFLVLAGYRIRTAGIEWSTVFISCTALTILLVAIEMRKPSYHGVGWKTINPGLRDWWLKQHGARSAPEAQPGAS